MERLDVYDNNGNLTGQIKKRSGDFQNGKYHLASSLWIVNSSGMVLIQKRSSKKKTAPNKWSITGGAVMSGETSMHGCIREAWEEIGLKLNEYDMKFLYRSFGESIIYDDYITMCDFSITEFVLQADEVSEVKWVTVQEVMELFYKGNFMFEKIEELEKVKNYIKENIR